MTRKEMSGAIVWILTWQFFVMQGVVQTAWTTPFSLAHNMISDLGRETCGPLYRAPGIDIACSPWHVLMNVSIALNGLLIPAGAYLTRKAWPSGRLVTIALVMIALTGPGNILVGLFPSDSLPRMHELGAGIILVIANPGMVVAGFGLWPQRGVAVLSLLSGGAAIIGTLLFLADISLGIGLGGMERVAFYPLPLWCGMMGATLLRRRNRVS